MMHRILLLTLVTLPLFLTSSLHASEPTDEAIPSRLAAQTLLLDATRAGDRLIAVGQWGHILLSDDSGTTWHQAKKVPTRMNLTSVSFASPDEGWVVGHDMVVLHTSDGGETWEMQYSDPQFEAPLLSVYFESSTRGFATGSFGTLLITEDGGKTWTRTVVETRGDDPHLNAIFPGPRDSSLFIAAEMGLAYRSDDGGKTWINLELPYEGSFWGGLTLKDGSILLFGMRGHIFHSRDLGENWTELEVNSEDHQSLSDGVQLSNGHIVLGGLGGSVVYGNADATGFRGINLEHRRGISGVIEAPNGDILLFGAFGVEKVEE